MKRSILERTGWSEIEYQYLINLRLIDVIRKEKHIDVDATIDVARGNLVYYMYQSLNKLDTCVRSAELIKMDY